MIISVCQFILLAPYPNKCIALTSCPSTCLSYLTLLIVPSNVLSIFILILDLSPRNAIIAGSKDGTIWMWLSHNGQCVQVFAGHDGGVSCGEFGDEYVIVRKIGFI